MSEKEIIIEGQKEKVNILFECNHIEDLEAFNMIKQSIEITPENAPIGDFEIKIISNTHSVYGFSSICKRNKNSDDWEFMGFGHSGACSVVTALLKAIQRKEKECDELKERASIAEDNFACEIQARLYHQNEWLKFSKECEELKKQLKTSEKWRINAESLNEKLDIKNTRYRKALEEIEQELKEDIYCESQECGCDDSEECLRCTKDLILDIINKAKDDE